MGNEMQLPAWLRERMVTRARFLLDYYVEHAFGVECITGAIRYQLSEHLGYEIGSECYRALLEAGPEFDEAAAKEFCACAVPVPLGGVLPVEAMRYQHSQDRAALAAMRAENDKLRNNAGHTMRVINDVLGDKNREILGVNIRLVIERDSLKAEVARLREALAKCIIVLESSPTHIASITVELAREALRGGK